MTKTANTRTLGMLVPTVENVPRISEGERLSLRASLDQAQADIAAGNFDVVTSETLQAEFDEIFHHDEADDLLEEPSGRSTS